MHPLLCGYPCPELCATAVAYKLAQALTLAAGGVGEDRELEQDLDLVALATIADVVPLVGENRTLVRRGLRALASTAKPGLRALMAVVGRGPRQGQRARRRLRARAAAERRGTPVPRRCGARADPDRGTRARASDRRGAGPRQPRAPARGEAASASRPKRRSPRSGSAPAYVLAGEGWHPGVIGIVASRLVERHRRPVVMIALDGETGKGSGRSIEAFDLLGGLSACAEHLRGYGGHRAAAGLEIDRDRRGGVRRRHVRPRRARARTRGHGGRGAGGRGRGRRGARHDAGRGAAQRSRPSAAATPACRCSCPTPDSATAGRWAKASTCASRSNPAARAPARWRSEPAGACRSTTAPRPRRRSRWRSTSGTA